MIYLPAIKDLSLQPLRIASGWMITRNLFYALDPDEDLHDREILHLDRDIEDPWEDVLFYYFDRDLLWATHHNGRKLIDLAWMPQGDRNGRFVLSVKNGTSNLPDDMIELQHDRHKLRYQLMPDMDYSETVAVYESRSRLEIAERLDREMQD